MLASAFVYVVMVFPAFIVLFFILWTVLIAIYCDFYLVYRPQGYIKLDLKLTFTRSQRTASLSEHNKSAVTDHAIQQNYVINWAKATVIDREPDQVQNPTRWIKESVHIRKEGQQAMNRDEGSYQPSHKYDRFLDTTADRRVKIPKN